MKSLQNQFYRPNGTLQGDTAPFGNAGTGTGVGSDCCHGMSIEPNATNRRGGIRGATKSDEPGESMPCGPDDDQC